MEKEKLTDEKVVGGDCKLDNILNFQNFVLNEAKNGNKEMKKNKLKVKKRNEFIDAVDDNDAVIDPNDNPERFIKLREQFIAEEYKV